MLTIDDVEHHIMRAHVRGDGYVTLLWPKDASLRDLDYIKEAVNLQIDTFRQYARKELDATAEYDSWMAVLLAVAPAVPSDPKIEPKP